MATPLGSRPMLQWGGGVGVVWTQPAISRLPRGMAQGGFTYLQGAPGPQYTNGSKRLDGGGYNNAIVAARYIPHGHDHRHLCPGRRPLWSTTQGYRRRIRHRATIRPFVFSGALDY